MTRLTDSHFLLFTLLLSFQISSSLRSKLYFLSPSAPHISCHFSGWDTFSSFLLAIQNSSHSSKNLLWSHFISAVGLVRHSFSVLPRYLLKEPQAMHLFIYLSIWSFGTFAKYLICAWSFHGCCRHNRAENRKGYCFYQAHPWKDRKSTGRWRSRTFDFNH